MLGAWDEWDECGKPGCFSPSSHGNFSVVYHPNNHPYDHATIPYSIYSCWLKTMAYNGINICLYHMTIFVSESLHPGLIAIRQIGLFHPSFLQLLCMHLHGNAHRHASLRQGVLKGGREPHGAMEPLQWRGGRVGPYGFLWSKHVKNHQGKINKHGFTSSGD